MNRLRRNRVARTPRADSGQSASKLRANSSPPGGGHRLPGKRSTVPSLPSPPPPRSAGAFFCLFYQTRKKLELFSQKCLTSLDLCAIIVNCIIIAFTMDTPALPRGSRSKKGDFSRLSLCNLTNTKSERSIRLRPRHLPCPWVVRLAHEVPDVRADVFGGCTGHPSIYFPASPAPAAAREFARRCHTTH